MHYRNGRPAKVGDWVVGKTHNSNGAIRVARVMELMPKGGACNVKLHRWFQGYNYTGGVSEPVENPRFWQGEEDYAWTGELIHVMDGYRLALIASEAWRWDSDINPVQPLDT